jgi:N-methylhydantoinase A/oxoprolinase/acetone carboxylase beta subunit
LFVSANDLESIVQNTDFFIFSKMVNGYYLTNIEKQMLELIKEEPKTLEEISNLTGVHQYSYSMRPLEELGIITRIGLTPTDVLHTIGSYREYDHEASEIAVNHFSKIMGIEPKMFCANLIDLFIYKLSHEIISKEIYESIGTYKKCRTCESLIDSAIRPSILNNYSFSMKLNHKIIGIGAPVQAYLPQVAKILNTELVIPNIYDVGGAFGAITGNVLVSMEVFIKPKKGLSQMEDPPCTLHTVDEMKEFESLSEAVDYATSWGTARIKAMALSAGAGDVKVVVDRNDKTGTISYGDSGILFESRISFTAIGKPAIPTEEEE